MRVFVIKRLLVAFAIAFIGAGLPANCVGGAMMQSAGTIVASMEGPCSDMPEEPPTTELAKMLCGALACAGVVGTAQRIIATPDPGTCPSVPNKTDEMAGISVKPDPLPPRPTARA
jgi:hypothetical protein